MPIPLDRTSRRIVGVLIEKAFTTPNQYPLSLNAVMTGCNQKSNRSPVMNLTDFEVDGALKQLYIDQWATSATTPGSRVDKWKHRADERLALTDTSLAVIGELLLRGAQHRGELRQRASRMCPIGDAATLESILDELKAKDMVRVLARQPGERAARVDHMFYVAGENEDEGDAGTTWERPLAATPISVTRADEIEEAALDDEDNENDVEDFGTDAAPPVVVTDDSALTERIASLERRLEHVEKLLGVHIVDDGDESTSAGHPGNPDD